MKFRSIALTLVYLLCSWNHASAQGGSTGGNGGDAVLIGSTWENPTNVAFQLLDFYQINLKDPQQKLSHFAKQLIDSPTRDQLRLQRDLNLALSALPEDRLFQMHFLGVLGTLDPLLARIIAAPFALYEFERLDEVDFIDDFKSSADYREDRVKSYLDQLWKMQSGVHQVGRRILDQIQISNKVFNRMSFFDQVGLYFHEAIYALLKKTETHRYGQVPEHARVANGTLFKNLLTLGTPGDPFQLDQMSWGEYWTQLNQLYVKGENLKVTFERKKFYRITGQNFEFEYQFEPYRTSFFETYYLKPKLKNLSPGRS